MNESELGWDLSALAQAYLESPEMPDFPPFDRRLVKRSLEQVMLLPDFRRDYAAYLRRLLPGVPSMPRQAWCTEATFERLVHEGFDALNDNDLAMLTLGDLLLATLGQAVDEIRPPVWKTAIVSANTEYADQNSPATSNLEIAIKNSLSEEYALSLDDSGDHGKGQRTSLLIDESLESTDSRVTTLEGHSGVFEDRLDVRLSWNDEDSRVTITLGGGLKPGRNVERSVQIIAPGATLLSSAEHKPLSPRSAAWTFSTPDGVRPQSGSTVHILYHDRDRKLHAFIVLVVS